ncbi:MAG TPA: hypothetical protein PKZ34_03195, partial [Thermotogota bacterium]|nr:hypothetical protein [Thermotogota bacterium]
MEQRISRTKPATCAVIGSTGSIGTQTLEVIEHLGKQGFLIRVVGMAANNNPVFTEQLK